MFNFKKLSKWGVFTIIFSLVSLFSLLPLVGQAVDISAGDLIKSTSSSAVYYYGSDGNRYCFPNENTYKTWYSDFSSVRTISDAELAAIPLKGNVTYKPGVKMLKIQTDPKVYAVDSGGTLRWVGTEEAAVSLYGSDWGTKVDDISVGFFINYKIGPDINLAADFNQSEAESTAVSIDVDKGLVAGSEPSIPNEEPNEEPNGASLPAAPTLDDPGTSVETDTTITISWSMPSGADSYNLQQDTTSAFNNPVAIYSGTANSITNTPSPQAPTTYYYRVKANNSAGAGSWSNVVSIDITVSGAPSAPVLTDPGTSVDSGTNFDVSWNSVSGATTYVLERDTNSSFNNPTEIYSGAQTSFAQMFSPASNITYYYRVRAKNNVRYSTWSNVVDIQVQKVCVAPTTPVLTDPGTSVTVDTPVTLQWSAVADATEYIWEYYTDPTFMTPIAASAGAATSVSLNTAFLSTRYFRVRAVNSCGTSDWSNVVDLAVTPAILNVPAQYATIQAAIDAADAGDTIQIASGVYTEKLIPKSGLTIQGAGAGATIFQKSGDAAIEIKGSVDNVTISGFTVRNSGLRGFTSSRGAIDIDDSSNITISNCEVINNTSINGAGLDLDHADNVLIKNCVFAGNSASNIGSLSFTDADGIVLENVTVADNTGGFNGIGGIAVYYSNSDITIKNSIIWNNGNNLDITAGTVDVSYTDFGGGRSGTGNINQDPKFIGSGNYRLQSSSPAIDAGNPASSYSNEPAPNGGRINMGAYGNTSEATHVISYYCDWDWPQIIINKDTGQTLWVCPWSQPWCNPGYPQCCSEAGHINCTDMSL